MMKETLAPMKPAEGREAQRNFGITDNAKHADVIEGVPVVFGNTEFSVRADRKAA